MEPILYKEPPVLYFKELVDAAIEHQHVQVGADTTFYVVNLLVGFARDTAVSQDPLAIVHMRALNTGGSRQRRELRRVGDLSLFVAGFFSDSLKRSLVDVDYYATLGGHAYESLSRIECHTIADVFGELAEKFAAFVDVLAEVSERSSLTTNTDVLRLYERWLRTGSPRDRKRLASRGIIPNASIGHKFMQ